MSKKALYSFVALILAAALVIACGVGSSWFTNWNIKTWFNSWGQSQKQPDNPDDKDDTETERLSNFKLTTDSDNEVMLLSASLMSAPAAKAEDSYYLTATINPIYADVQTVEWSVMFINGSSEWASGKQVTDYVTVTADETNGLNARVDCKAPFGEQIKIRVTSTDNPEAYAECICDYVKRVKNIVFSELLQLPESGFTYSYECSDYTLDSEISLTFDEGGLYLTEGFKQAFKTEIEKVNWLRNCVLKDSVACNFSYADKRISIKTSYGFSALAMFVDESAYDTSEDGFYDGYDEAVSKAVRTAIKNFDGDMATLKANFTSSYGGQTFASFKKDINIRFDYDSVKVPVSSLGLNTDHIIM